MKIYKYISLNLFSIISYFFIFLFLYCLIQNRIITQYPTLYLTLENTIELYSVIIYALLLTASTFFIETYIRKTNPKKISKIHIKNKFIKYIHLPLFYFGFLIGCLNILAYILFLIVLINN